MAASFAAAYPTLRSQAATEDDLRLLREESYSRYSTQRPTDAEDALYAIAQEHADGGVVLRVFSEQQGISSSAAKAFLELIADTLRERGVCEHENGCSAAAVDAIARRYETKLASADQTGNLLTAVAKNLTQRLTPALLATIREHPRYRHVLTELHDYTNDGAFLVPLLERDSSDRAVLELFTRSARGVTDDIRLTVLELLLKQRVGVAAIEDAPLIAPYLNLLIEDGLHDRARAFFDSLSATDASAFWAAYASFDAETYLRTRESYEGDLALNLAAAYLAADRTVEARALLARSLSLLRSDLADPSPDWALAGLLGEVLEPRIDRDALFDYLIAGRPLDETAIASLDEERRGPSVSGWLSAARGSAPAARSVAREFLTTVGYHDMAKDLSEDAWTRRFDATLEDETTAKLRAALGAALGPEFTTRNAELRNLIRSRLGADKEPSPRESGANAVERAEPAMPFPFVEKRVPDAYRTHGAPAPSEVPAGFVVPVEEYQVARIAQGQGDDWYVVYASHALDPVGEVSRGGYWIMRSEDCGKTWAAPWYLGLQEYFPYVVAPDSKLPLDAGDKIQLEVLVRELDTQSITFPPVALATKAERDGVYLEFALADVTRDTDNDGLTDIVEQRFGTDPTREDSDGDRLRDDLDGVPLVPFDLAAVSNARIASAFLEAVYGVERAALITGLGDDQPAEVEQVLRNIFDSPHPAIEPEQTLFLSADPALFAGSNPRLRVILEGRGGDRAGVFYPLEITQMFVNHDASTVYISWSAHWQGGTILLTGGPERYTIHELGRWIT